MTNGKIGAAVLGAGGMGWCVAGHLRQCEQVGDLVVYDVVPEKAAKLAAKHHGRAAPTLAAAVNDPAVRVCFVTAANHAHPELVLASIAAGKAVLCEKPIANTLAEARGMVEAAERRGVFFQIGFECRYSRLYTKVKDWIDAGLLGEIVSSNCYYICSEFHHKGSWRNDPATGGSMFGEKLCHYVDLPRWWTGSPVVDVFSPCAPNVIPYYKVRDNYQTTYRCANGAVHHLTFHMAVGATFKGDPLQDVIGQQIEDGHALQYLVVGTKGAAHTDVFRRRIKRWAFGDSPECLTSDWVEDLTWPKSEDHLYYHNTLDQTFDVVRRVAAGEPPRTPARDAYESMRLVFAAERSADTGRLVRLDEVQ